MSDRANGLPFEDQTYDIVGQRAPTEVWAQVSIAISLRRIADAICGDHPENSLCRAILEIADRMQP